MQEVRSSPFSHRYVILVIVLVGVLMSVLDGIVVSIALPTITGAFAVDIASSQWTITAYLLTLTSLLLVFGRVAEFTGRSLLFILGLAVFTLSSLACGLAATLTQLIVFRVVQGIGGAMVFSISGAILFLAFPPAGKGTGHGLPRIHRGHRQHPRPDPRRVPRGHPRAGARSSSSTFPSGSFSWPAPCCSSARGKSAAPFSTWTGSGPAPSRPPCSS